MKNNLIALVILAVFPFVSPAASLAQAASDELLEEAQPAVSTETDDLLSEMDAGTSPDAEATDTPVSAKSAVAVPAPAASNAAFERIESIKVSDSDLVTFMKSGGLRSRMMK